jgi:hypothetical protein
VDELGARTMKEQAEFDGNTLGGNENCDARKKVSFHRKIIHVSLKKISALASGSS